MLPIFRKIDTGNDQYLRELKKKDDAVWRVLKWLTIFALFIVVFLVYENSREEIKVPGGRMRGGGVVQDDLLQLR